MKKTLQSEILPQRSRALIRLKNLSHNLLVLQNLLKGKGASTTQTLTPRFFIPMVKANAYGHGLEPVAAFLVRNAKKLKIQALGVASLEEGAQIREKVSSNIPLHVYSGAVFSGNKARCEVLDFCKKYQLVPTISSMESLESFLSRGELIPFQIKWNTGMNRLGIDWVDAKKVEKLSSKHSAKWNRNLLAMLTHFANAESFQSDLNQKQWRRFLNLRESIKQWWQGPWHFANSAAIWNNKYFQVAQSSQWVRPGISLYGIPPWANPQKSNPRVLKPVMEWQAKVLQLRDLQPQEHVGYGGTYVQKSSRSLRVATLGVGYGDGLHRVLSNQTLPLGDSRSGLQILGRISMDLTVVRAHPRWKIGDWITLSGGTGSDLWSLSEKALTMPYEWLTSVSPRVERNYVE